LSGFKVLGGKSKEQIGLGQPVELPVPIKMSFAPSCVDNNDWEEVADVFFSSHDDFLTKLCVMVEVIAVTEIFELTLKSCEVDVIVIFNFFFCGCLRVFATCTRTSSSLITVVNDVLVIK
jgi:hypothetical protein